MVSVEHWTNMERLIYVYRKLLHTDTRSTTVSEYKLQVWNIPKSN